MSSGIAGGRLAGVGVARRLLPIRLALELLYPGHRLPTLGSQLLELLSLLRVHFETGK